MYLMFLCVLSTAHVHNLFDLTADELVDRNCECCVTCCIDYEGWLQFQNCLYGIVKDPLFELFITTCIVLNTLFLALEHHGMSENVRQALDIGNKVGPNPIQNKIEFKSATELKLQLFQVFTSIFTLECIMKVMAMSKDFFACGWNIFDLIIVSASLLDLIFELVDGLSVLRGLRLVSIDDLYHYNNELVDGLSVLRGLRLVSNFHDYERLYPDRSSSRQQLKSLYTACALCILVYDNDLDCRYAFAA